MKISLSKTFMAVALMMGTMTSVSYAQNYPLAERESATPPVLDWLKNNGVKLTLIGEEGGVKGYLGESSDGKMQAFYVMPDGNHVVAGVLFKNGGTNITGVQIGEMRARFDAASREVENAGQNLNNITNGSTNATPISEGGASEIKPVETQKETSDTVKSSPEDEKKN